MTTRVPAVVEPDVGRLLGITGPGGWAVAALFAATYSTLALFSGGAPFAAIEGKVTLALVIAAAVALVVPGRFPLALPVTGAVVAVVTFGTTATVWHLDPHGWPGWTSWQFGANTFLMFGLALRGRVVAATVGLLLMSIITVHWTWMTTGDGWHGFDLVYRQLATFGAGAFFAVWLRRTARHVVQFQAAEARRLAEEGARVAAEEERRAQLDRVQNVAGAALAVIATGSPTPSERLEHRLLEAELRDGIRGRALVSGPLPVAVRAARERGVEVTVLDDLRDDAVPADFLAGATVWAAAQVAETRAGELTIRLARRGGTPVVTVAATGRNPAAYSG